MQQRILVTGGAGFIGSTVVEKLLSQDNKVTVVDNFDPFYDRSVKEKNIHAIIDHPNFKLIEGNIIEKDFFLNELNSHDFDVIIHLAAKAGVRPSIADPLGYQDANVKGTQNLLEFARHKNIRQFIFASSSSVYGINENTPWSEDDHVLQPISPYASTKVSGELLGHVYSHLYNIRFLALRFFTVYGPRQRPDLAIHKFAKSILAGNPITMFGDGNTKRDYTYIDDIVSGIINAIDYSGSMYEVINLGNSQTVSLSEMIKILEEVFQKKALIVKEADQPGDVPLTYAETAKAKRLLGYEAKTSFREGIANFRKWLLETNNK